MDDGQQIACSVLDFPRQIKLPLLGLFAIGDIHADAANARDAALGIESCSGSSEAPTQLAILRAHTKLGLTGRRTWREVFQGLAEAKPIVWFEELDKILCRCRKSFRVDSENPELAFVTRVAIGRQIPIP
ncbi:MAG TPA: hypothetical protein VIG26_04920 [Methyloceanibacter sp.]